MWGATVSAHPSYGSRSAELRYAFDRSFAEPRRPTEAAPEDFLSIGVGDLRCAVRLGDVAELIVDRPVTPLPGEVAGLLGVASASSGILPVYDLRVLIGRPATASARWMLVAAERPVGLAFDRLDAHLRVPRTARAPGDAPDASRASSSVLLFVDESAHPVLDLAAILRRIEESWQSGGRSRER